MSSAPPGGSRGPGENRSRRAGKFRFFRPDGAAIVEVPELPVTDVTIEMANATTGLDISTDTGACQWDGGRFDYDLGVTAVLQLDGRI